MLQINALDKDEHNFVINMCQCDEQSSQCQLESYPHLCLDH